MLLLDALTQLFPDSSKRTLHTWIRNKRILVNSRYAKRHDESVESSDEICLAPHVVTTAQGCQILHADRSVIVIDKPHGLLSVPLDVPGSPNCLNDLKRTYKTDQIYAIHRIDRETSGVLAFARGKKAHDAFVELFSQHAIVRKYVAVVEGSVRKNEGTWRSHLKELPHLDVVCCKSGKLAITHYRVLKRSQDKTLLELTLETGRKHQIRVQSQVAGHPVRGDKRYDGPEAKRLFLHAQYLGFTHPFTHKEMAFDSPTPSNFDI